MSVKIISKILRVVFIFLLVYFSARIFTYHYDLIVFPYADILREAALISNTWALVHHLNPFSFDLQPEYTNVYGIVYPMFVAPFASIFGVTPLIHRVVTGLFLWGCCAIIFLVLRKRKVDLLLNLWCQLMLYASLVYPGTSSPCADPALTGLFFMLLTIFVPFFFEYSLLSLFFGLIFGLLAFYAKPYFLLALPILASYLFFFVSKKKGLGFIVIAIGSLLASVIIMNHLFPAYFDNTFFTHKNPAKEWASMERLTSQLHSYITLHLGIFILTAGILFYRLWQSNIVMSFKISSIYLHLTNIFQIKKRNEPLFRFSLPIEVYAGICSLMVLLLMLGKHSGATLWYFFQLLSPFLVMCIAQIVSSFAFWSWAAIPFLIFNLHVLTATLDFPKNPEGWSHVKELLETKKNIYGSPLIATTLIEQNKTIYDNGLTYVFGWGAARKGIWKYLLKEDERVYKAMILYDQKLGDKIANKEFDLVMIQSCSPAVCEALNRYYRLIGFFPIYAPQDRISYSTGVWLPNE